MSAEQHEEQDARPNGPLYECIGCPACPRTIMTSPRRPQVQGYHQKHCNDCARQIEARARGNT